MNSRISKLGYVLAVIGLLFFVVAGVAYMKTQEGYRALDAFSSEQNVALTYNDEGVLVDRGTPEGAAAIMSLLTDDWDFTVNGADLDPDDPIVDTATEYMYQMATIAYHTLTGTQTVVLTEPVEWDGDGLVCGVSMRDLKLEPGEDAHAS